MSIDVQLNLRERNQRDHTFLFNGNTPPYHGGYSWKILFNVAGFSANNLKVAIRADDAKNNTFTSEILAPTDSCQSECGIEENTRRQHNVNFMFDKKTHVSINIFRKVLLDWLTYKPSLELWSKFFTFHLRCWREMRNRFLKFIS